jgi:hypothetical protein
LGGTKQRNPRFARLLEGDLNGHAYVYVIGIAVHDVCGEADTDLFH